ncbi:hypothetical protein LBMAG20_01300 [Methylocystaceae bacterium]|nr:hypothetical protein LBMAG20_01300 [Methylocystaceae bacterium]
MRYSPQIFILILTLLTPLLTASAQTSVTLTQAVPLRLKPKLSHKIIETAPAGSSLILLQEDEEWSHIDFQGRRFYAPTAKLTMASQQTSATATDDPTCDYGYPYSGSNLFFDRPLAKLRHSEPLGFLFGYHRRSPC